MTARTAVAEWRSGRVVEWRSDVVAEWRTGVVAEWQGWFSEAGSSGSGRFLLSFSSAFLLIYLFLVSAPVPRLHSDPAFLLIYLFLVSAPVPRLHSDHLFVFAITFIPFQPYLHSPRPTMPVTRNRGALRGKATRGNLTACRDPFQTRLERRQQQLPDGNEEDVALADAERKRPEAKAEDQQDQERARPDEPKARRIRLEELAAEEAALEAEAAQRRETEAANRQIFLDQEAELARAEARLLAL